MKLFRTLFLSVLLILLSFNLATAQPVEEPVMKLMPASESVDVSDWLEAIPNLKQGVIYSLDDSQIKYCSTIELVELWKKITVEAGAVPIDNELIGVVSYEIAKLKDYGVTLPILELVEFNLGAFVGVKDLGENHEFDYGISATLLNLKF